jgi:hypothetical protein
MVDQLEPDRPSNQTPNVKDIGGDLSVCDDNFGDTGKPHGRTNIHIYLVGWHLLVYLIVAPILLCCFLFFFTMNILNFRFFIQRKIR